MNNIAMTPVASSNIAAHGYDAASQTLAVQFKGGKVYHYSGVPQDTADAFIAAESKGSHFAREIRPAFEGKLFEEPEEDRP